MKLKTWITRISKAFYTRLVSTRFNFSEQKLTFVRWLNYRVAKTSMGEVPPIWIRIVYFILFPLHWSYTKQSQVKYDFSFDTYTIRGVELSSGIIDALSRDAEKGMVIKIIKTENGIVTCERLS